MITRVAFDHVVIIDDIRHQSVDLDDNWEIDFSTGHYGPGVIIDVSDKQKVFVPMSNIVSIDETF